MPSRTCTQLLMEKEFCRPSEQQISQQWKDMCMGEKHLAKMGTPAGSSWLCEAMQTKAQNRVRVFQGYAAYGQVLDEMRQVQSRG